MQKPMDQSYKLFINGKWTDSVGGGTCEAYCPANGELLATFVDASREDVDNAVKAAWQAFPGWKATSPAQRSAVMMKLADLIDQNTEVLAATLCFDNGKAIREARMEVPRSSDLLRYFACAVRTMEDQATLVDKDTLGISLREPYGVVGLIVPWNFPFLLAMYKNGPCHCRRKYGCHQTFIRYVPEPP